MPRIIKFILFLLLFGIVFELGLLTSYILVTSQPPDVGRLIDMQVDKLTAIRDSITAGFNEGPTKETVNVTNVDVVASTLMAKTQLSGINVDTLGAQLPEGATGDNITVTLTATGYKEIQTGGAIPNVTDPLSGQIVIQSERYSITATAVAKRRFRGVEVDANTIQVTALEKLHSQ
ncbi:MAG: hypothetical protein PQ964_05100 [Methanobacteriaceae archaeon]